jgi:hypothetical protein
MPTVADTCPPIWNAQNTAQGTFTGEERPCRVKGCRGWRVQIRWPDGSVTWPCSRGFQVQIDGSARIVRAHADLYARGRAHPFRTDQTDQTDQAGEGAFRTAKAQEAPIPPGVSHSGSEGPSSVQNRSQPPLLDDLAAQPFLPPDPASLQE